MISWDKEAEALLQKVPFFVRGKVKKKIEEWARAQGERKITSEIVLACQRHFQKGGVEKAFVVEGCFGAHGCPNAITNSSSLLKKLERILQEEDLEGFLRTKISGPLKHHHQFRVALAECPNACSQVQIRDLALIGQIEVKIKEENCQFCGQCESVCEEKALEITPQGPRIDQSLCLRCGACLKTCEFGALYPGRKGYRVLVGGKLGRHPQLARELLPLASEEEVLSLVKRIIAFYKAYNEKGEKLGAIINRLGWEKALNFWMN